MNPSDDPAPGSRVPDGVVTEGAAPDLVVTEGAAPDLVVTEGEAPDLLEDDDEIVLAWWQHPVNVVTVVLATALIAGMIGWLIADSNAGPDPNEVDVGFLQDMRDHHEQAIHMSNIYLQLQDTEPGLRTVARSIVFGQAVDIGRMIQLLRDFDAAEVNEGETSMGWMGMEAPVGQMPGMATQEQLDALGASRGAEADALFVELMTAHHEGAIHMAEYAAENANVEEVRNMTASMARSQREEIGEMQRLLS